MGSSVGSAVNIANPSRGHVHATRRSRPSRPAVTPAPPRHGATTRDHFDRPAGSLNSEVAPSLEVSVAVTDCASRRRADREREHRVAVASVAAIASPR